MKMSVSKNAFCDRKFVFEQQRICELCAFTRLYWHLKMRRIMSHTVYSPWIRTRLYLSPTSPPRFMPSESRTWELFYFFNISHVQNSSSSVRSANKPQRGRGMYFANISIKWSVKVRPGGRHGWGEGREAPGLYVPFVSLRFRAGTGQSLWELWSNRTVLI